MRITEDQITFYHENGYLKIEKYIAEEEIEKLYTELPKTIEKDSSRIILENNGSIRSIFAPHFVNDAYNRLSRLDRFIVPSEQLLKSKIYLHQFKINTKQGLKGDWWEWHQDFPYWNIDDGIENPEMISILIYLQDTDASNGALLLIPKSHKQGIVNFAAKDSLLKTNYNSNYKVKNYLSSLNADLKYTIDPSLIKELALENNIVVASGKKGTALFFHGNIFHASNVNLTPFDRDAIIITYNSINNLPSNIQNPRPEFLCGRNYEPIENLEKSI